MVKSNFEKAMDLIQDKYPNVVGSIRKTGVRNEKLVAANKKLKEENENLHNILDVYRSFIGGHNG